jgi:DNA polymerase-4
LYAHTLTVKVKYHNFQQITRSLTFNGPIKKRMLMLPVFQQLLEGESVGQTKVRLLGVTLSSLEQQSLYYQQVDLFD